MTAAELRGLLEKATPLPWLLQGRTINGRDFTGAWRYICDQVRGGSPEAADANAALIVAALNALPALLAAVEAAERADAAFMVHHEHFIACEDCQDEGACEHAATELSAPVTTTAFALHAALAPFAPTPGDAS